MGKFIVQHLLWVQQGPIYATASAAKAAAVRDLSFGVQTRVARLGDDDATTIEKYRRKRVRQMPGGAT